jgi:hemerythrin-like domain-containing protein
MKRHISLRSLSSDHHHGLVQARRLVNATTGSVSVAQDFLTFFREETNRHFREEEEVLLPAFARYGDVNDPALIKVLVEHVLLRTLVSDLIQQVGNGSPAMETMHELGAMLQLHIRFEENVLFPLIERTMPDDALHRLYSDLQNFEQRAHGT